VTALLLIAPCAAAAAQDSTQAQDHKQNQDSSYQSQTADNNRWNAPQGDEAVLMRMHRTNQMEIRVGKLAQRNGRSAKVKAFGAKLARDHAAADQKLITLGNKLGFTLTRGEQMDSTGKWGRQGRDGMDRDRMGQRPDSSRVDTAYRQGYNQTPADSNRASNPQNQQNGQYQPNGQQTGQNGQQNGQYQQTDSTRRDDMRAHMQQMQQLGTLRGAAFDTAFANMMVEGHQKAISMLEQAQGQIQHEELRTLITATLPTLRGHLQTAQSLGGKASTTTSSLQ